MSTHPFRGIYVKCILHAYSILTILKRNPDNNKSFVTRLFFFERVQFLNFQKTTINNNNKQVFAGYLER